MHPPGAETVLIRHGEIGVKSSQVQHSMEGRLRNNIAALLADRGVEGDVSREHGRLYVETNSSSVESVTKVTANTYGVVSSSPSLAVEPTMNSITDSMAATALERYDGGSFAVRARRAGDNNAHDFSTQDLLEFGGEAVWNAIETLGEDPDVDLDDPDWEIFVEARPNRAFLFLEHRDGLGGLPLGSQSPVVALISGGIDSPVAAWLAMKRGTPVVPLYIDLGDYGGPDHRARAEATVANLAEYAPNFDLDLRVVDAGDAIDRLVGEMDQFRMLGLRRFMLAVAANIATNIGAIGIVTGESIGQKSSQTATNLRVTSEVTDFPVHRPLLTMDKTDITKRARMIGTFEDSTIDAGCNRVAPSQPATAADLEQVQAAEPGDLLALARRVAEKPVEISRDALATGEAVR